MIHHVTGPNMLSSCITKDASLITRLIQFHSHARSPHGSTDGGNLLAALSYQPFSCIEDGCSRMWIHSQHHAHSHMSGCLVRISEQGVFDGCFRIEMTNQVFKCGLGTHIHQGRQDSVGCGTKCGFVPSRGIAAGECGLLNRCLIRQHIMIYFHSRKGRVWRIARVEYRVLWVWTISAANTCSVTLMCSSVTS